MPANQTRGIKLIVQAVGDKALRKISNRMDRVSKSASSVSRNFKFLRNAFVGVFAAKGIASVAKMADTVQLTGDRINAFVGDTQKGAEALDLLFQAADRTNASVDTLSDGFNRIALATQELGLSTEEMIAFTTTLQNAFRIQGASASESRGAIIQLTQGLASGALRGQELRSVLEASAVAGSVIADSVGIARGELIKFAETGALTSEVVLKAFSGRALELDERAAKLGTTFGQTLTKATNRFKQGLNSLNRDLELNKKFEESVLGATEGLTKLFKVVTQSSEFRSLLDFIKDFSKGSANIAESIFGKDNKLKQNNEEISKTIERIKFVKNEIRDFESLQKSTSLIDKFNLSFKNESVIKNYREELTTLRNEFDTLVETNNKLTKSTLVLADAQSKSKNSGPDAIGDLIKNFSQSKFDQILQKGALTLQKLNLIFKDRKSAKDIDAYRIAVLKLEKLDLEKQFSQGAISAIEQAEALRKINTQIGLLDGKFNPIQAGARNALEGIEDFSTETANAVTNSFSTLEDSLFEFTKTGKFLFNDFAQAVLDDLSRVIIRTQLIRPLLSQLGLVDATTTAGGTGAVAAQAKGGVFSGGKREAFAKGGVVNSPTMFPMRGGTGLMGESGRAEAIVPLQRVSGGDLGIKALPSNTVVNVINNTGAEIETEETTDGSTRYLDITITKAVANAITQGRLDKPLGTSFGISRKGSR